MRILAIRGCNLASLAGEFSIDFEADPLASSGIFAITGPTGAGKSTLLDAVCLALFAEMPRLRAAPDRAHVGEDGEETLSAKDTRSILRHGTSEGYAEIDFAMPGGAIYRARWSVRRARGNAEGNLQHYKHSFERLDTAEGMGGTRRETKAAIGEVIGLSAEQFTRAVLLGITRQCGICGHDGEGQSAFRGGGPVSVSAPIDANTTELSTELAISSRTSLPNSKLSAPYQLDTTNAPPPSSAPSTSFLPSSLSSDDTPQYCAASYRAGDEATPERCAPL